MNVHLHVNPYIYLMLQKNIVEIKKINTFTIIIDYIIMNVDAPVATAARIKKSRLKQSTKAKPT